MSALTHEDLLYRFPSLRDIGDGVLKCKDAVPMYTFHYYVRLSAATGDVDRLMVSQDREDDAFAREVLTRLQGVSLEKGLSFRTMPEGVSAFPKVLQAPPHFHAYFKGRLDEQRERLVWCVPVYVSEFGGKETAEEFRELCYRFVPVRDWSRGECPKILLRFDNPTTGGGTGDEYIFATYKKVLREIDQLSEDGFIEILNYREQVIEVLRNSNLDAKYSLYRDRSDVGSRVLEKNELVGEVWRFLTAA